MVTFHGAGGWDKIGYIKWWTNRPSCVTGGRLPVWAGGWGSALLTHKMIRIVLPLPEVQVWAAGRPKAGGRAWLQLWLVAYHFTDRWLQFLALFGEAGVAPLGPLANPHPWAHPCSSTLQTKTLVGVMSDKALDNIIRNNG